MSSPRERLAFSRDETSVDPSARSSITPTQSLDSIVRGRALRRRERSSLLKNRMREICTSGSVRGGDGNIPAYSAGCLCDRAGRTTGLVKPPKAREGIGLQDPGIALQKGLRVRAPAIR